MASSEEILALARRFVSHEVAPDMCAEWREWTPRERRETISLTCSFRHLPVNRC